MLGGVVTASFKAAVLAMVLCTCRPKPSSVCLVAVIKLSNFQKVDFQQEQSYREKGERQCALVADISSHAHFPNLGTFCSTLDS